MRMLMTGTLPAGACRQLARAEEISSVYTELNVDKDCTTFAMQPKRAASTPISPATAMAAIPC